jgi:endoglucanase
MRVGEIGDRSVLISGGARAAGLVLMMAGCGVAGAAVEPGVRVNQVGYLPGWPKVALAPAEAAAGGAAEVRAVADGRVAWRGVARAVAGGLCAVDFSSMREPGTYVLAVDGQLSPPFAIGPSVYDRPLRLLLRSYFLQRCGVALDDAETGLAHGACHTADGTVARADEAGPAGRVQPAAGGWHDAGDYGKYVATGTVAVARLLAAYAACPALFPDRQLDIPESGNGRSDLLDEAAFELAWLLAMQRADGAVCRKLSGARWPAIVAPDGDDQPRFLYGVSTAETAKFAGALALAARVLGPTDRPAAARYEAAARRAWRYLERHPGQSEDWEKSDDSGSGPYRLSAVDREATLSTDVDDRFFAAAELWLATGERRFRRYLERHEREVPYNLFEWKNAAPLAILDLLAAKGTGRPLARRLRVDLRAGLLARAEERLAVAGRDPWGGANDRLVWGSNKMAAEEGITLFEAFRRTGRARFHEAALDQLHGLLGRNPLGKSFVTGVGADPVAHASHIFARAVGHEVPGLLVGGPNELEQSGIAPRGQGALSYADDARSYATNEPAIDYNASLLGLLTLALAEGRGKGGCRP